MAFSIEKWGARRELELGNKALTLHVHVPVFQKLLHLQDLQGSA